MKKLFDWTLFTFGGMLLGGMSNHSYAQINPDRLYDSSIHTILIHPLNNPIGVPITSTDPSNPLLVSFDDFKADYQDYYYTIELVDTKWAPVAVGPFEYIKGFTQNKINSFTVSSIAIQRYYHYQFTIPNQNCQPVIPGNYILKVFKDGDPSKILFTKRFFVANNTLPVYATVKEPYDGNLSKTHQKIQISVDVKNMLGFQSDQLKLVVFQNQRWNDALEVNAPNFMRGNILEYNNESDLIFPAGKESRWLDLQSLRLKSDRINQFINTADGTHVILKPDQPRSSIAYFTFKDLNGAYIVSNTESLQSESQNDYAKVSFTYVPQEGIPYMGEQLYLTGNLTNNTFDKGALMQFNAQKGVYEKTLLLKQGYYSYQYVLRDKLEPQYLQDYAVTEGDHWETENNYTILAYYTPSGALYPMLVGFSTINTKTQW